MSDVFEQIGAELRAANAEGTAPPPIQKGDPLAGVDISKALLSTESTNVAAGLTDGTEPVPRDPAKVAREGELLNKVSTDMQQEQALQDLGKRTIVAIDAARLAEQHQWNDDPFDLEDHKSNLIVAQQIGAHLRQSDEAGENFAWMYALRANGYDPALFDIEDAEPEELEVLVEQAGAMLEAGKIAAVEGAEHDLATTQAEYAEALDREREQAFIGYFGQVRSPEKRAQAFEMVMGAMAADYGGDQAAALESLFAGTPNDIVFVLETYASALAAEKQAEVRSNLENVLRGSLETEIANGLSTNATPAPGVPYLREARVNMSDLQAAIPQERELTREDVIAAITGKSPSDAIGEWSNANYKRAIAANEAEAAKRRR